MTEFKSELAAASTVSGDTQAGRMFPRAPDGTVSLGWLEGVVQAVIVLSLVAFSLETLPDLAAW